LNLHPRPWNTYAVLPALEALIQLQKIDSAAETARRRLGELPAAEEAAAARVAEAEAVVVTVRENLAANQHARRGLEKDVGAVDSRLARFDDHKAAVKTNQEYTALLHEIATAKSEKDALEERILVLMEEADGLSEALGTAEAGVAGARREVQATRASLASEADALEQEVARLTTERATHMTHVDARGLALYEQLLRGRRGIAVAPMERDICSACHVRLRPHVTQLVRRNEELVQCESCQRILYFLPPEAASSAASA
jgi:uncharacterized protein